MLGRKPNDFVTVKDVPAYDFILAYAEHLKKSSIIEVPEVRTPTKSRKTDPNL